MAKRLTISQQIQAIAKNAEILRKKVPGKTLPGYDDALYLRPVAGGWTVLSIDPQDRPQQGFAIKDIEELDPKTLRKGLEQEFADRANKQTRLTPEKALQAFLIRDAIRHKGWMAALNTACTELTGKQSNQGLRFLADEVSFSDATKTVCDLIAVLYQDGKCVPVAIELKSARQLKTLKKQVNDSAKLIEANLVEFQALAEAAWGKKIKLEAKAERWIVWPAYSAKQQGDKDPQADKCREQGIRVVTYVASHSLVAASRSKLPT